MDERFRATFRRRAGVGAIRTSNPITAVQPMIVELAILCRSIGRGRRAQLRRGPGEGSPGGDRYAATGRERESAGISQTAALPLGHETEPGKGESIRPAPWGPSRR